VAMWMLESALAAICSNASMTSHVKDKDACRGRPSPEGKKDNSCIERITSFSFHNTSALSTFVHQLNCLFYVFVTALRKIFIARKQTASCKYYWKMFVTVIWVAYNRSHVHLPEDRSDVWSGMTIPIHLLVL
jgi:hypothetical protein